MVKEDLEEVPSMFAKAMETYASNGITTAKEGRIVPFMLPRYQNLSHCNGDQASEQFIKCYSEDEKHMGVQISSYAKQHIVCS